MLTVINPNLPLVAAQGVTAPVVLQPGSVISARVLQILGNDTVRIAIGSQSIDVLSQVPLQAGQALQLAVSQTPDGITLALVDPQGSASASQGLADTVSAAATSDFVTLAPGAAASIAAQTTPAVVVSQNQLTPLEALAVSVAAQTAATQQTVWRRCLPIWASPPGWTRCRCWSNRRWRNCWRGGPASIKT